MNTFIRIGNKPIPSLSPARLALKTLNVLLLLQPTLLQSSLDVLRTQSILRMDLPILRIDLWHRSPHNVDPLVNEPHSIHRHTADLLRHRPASIDRRPFMDFYFLPAPWSFPGIISNKCWMINIKETCLFDETVQFIRNYEHCSAASYCCCRSSRVFHAVDSATLQATHRCTPAPYGMLAVPAALPTHSFGDVDPCLDSDLRTPC